MKKLILIITITFFSYSNIIAQDVIKDFLSGPIDDTKLLIEGYMSPFGSWFGTGLNAGWYNTGKPHSFPGFDVTAGLHLITPPNNAMTFQPVLSELIINSENNELSTFIGPNNSTMIGYTDPITGQFKELFEAPGGLGWNQALPMPYLQGSIGLIKKTEILFRFAPKINVEDLKMGYWGLGFKHDIKQWIPVVNKIPFDLSFVTGYSKLNSNLNFTNPGQNLNFDVTAFNSNLVLSKKLAFLTPYIGVGYQYSKSALSLNGDYTISNWNGEEIIEGINYNITDPFDISFGGVNGFKANMGARIKLLLFTLHVDWTMAEYNMFTMGIGLNSDIGSKIIGGSIEKGLENK